MSAAAAHALAHAIAMNFMNFTGQLEVAVLACSQWASVTFTGARHRLEVRLAGAGAVGAAADFLAELPELDLPIPGHVVADISLLAEERRGGGADVRLVLEALTIEDR